MNIYLDNLESNLCTYSALLVATPTSALNVGIALHHEVQIETRQYFSNIPVRWRKFITINYFDVMLITSKGVLRTNLIYLLFEKALANIV